MKVEPRLIFRTLEELLGVNSISVKYDDTYDSIEMLDGNNKPSLEDFKVKYEELKNVTIPFETLRMERNVKLLNSDWTINNDSPLSTEKIQEWKVYRQALRDLPANTTDPENPVWPQAPTH